MCILAELPVLFLDPVYPSVLEVGVSKETSPPGSVCAVSLVLAARTTWQQPSNTTRHDQVLLS